MRIEIKSKIAYSELAFDKAYGIAKRLVDSPDGSASSSSKMFLITAKKHKDSVVSTIHKAAEQ